MRASIHLRAAKRLLDSMAPLVPEDATDMEVAYAEAATIDYLKDRFGEQDDALGNWPRDWHDCPEAWELYKQKIMECRAAEAAAHVAAAEEAAAEDRARGRLAQLRQTFESAVRRLDAIPETELSPSGRPFIKECADAMLAFAAWFGEQTPDDISIIGNAYRVCYAFGGLSGVIDWIALHGFVPFANEIEHDAADLFKEAETFDRAVMKAHTVARKRNKLIVEQQRLSDRTYSDLEERIGRISSLASRLGGRLQRVAAWAAEIHPSARPEGRSHPEAAGKQGSATDDGVGAQPVISAKAPRMAAADKPVIELGPPGEPCRVLRKEKRPLTDGQYAVISRLLKAGSEGLSKDALEAVRPSARRILKTLRKDPDWAKVILMPGQTNGRYRLKM